MSAMPVLWWFISPYRIIVEGALHLLSWDLIYYRIIPYPTHYD